MTSLAQLTAADARRRFLLLLSLRWLSTGLLIPVLILIMSDRGLTLGEIGLVTAAQGVAVFALELPTGGLADALGRRNVLLVASLFSFSSSLLFVFADTVLLFVVVWLIQGVYRALESGPLDSWYVDAALADDPEADIESTLTRGGVVLGMAIAVGSLMSSGLVSWADRLPIEPLVLPVLVSLALIVIEFVAITTLMAEPAQIRHQPLSHVFRDVPRTIRMALGTIRGSRVLMSLVAVEVFWGFGMTAFELFTPIKLEVVIGSTQDAAQIMGPAQTAAWVASAVGAALVPRLTARVGAERAGATLLVLQGLFVVGLGVAAGPVGVVIAFVVTMLTHGAVNPVHLGLLHRAVTDHDRRATVVSVNSLCARTGGMVGAVALGALSDATTLTTAMLVGAGAIALASPFLLLARHERHVGSQPLRV